MASCSGSRRIWEWASRRNTVSMLPTSFPRLVPSSPLTRYQVDEAARDRRRCASTTAASPCRDEIVTAMRPRARTHAHHGVARSSAARHVLHRSSPLRFRPRPRFATVLAQPCPSSPRSQTTAAPPPVSNRVLCVPRWALPAFH